jgi:hypothetical protein
MKKGDAVLNTKSSYCRLRKILISVEFLIYWLVGFAAYLVIHIMISTFFGWTFMFPFWEVKLL